MMPQSLSRLARSNDEARQTATAAPIAFSYVTPAAYALPEPAVSGHILAAVIHGAMDPSPRPWPQVRSGLRPLDGSGTIELLHCSQAPRYASHDGFDLAITEEFLFAAWNPGAGDPAAAAAIPLEALAEVLYGRLFALIDRLGFPHLQRVWNVVPAINGTERGMERYQRFCLGRHAAFDRHKPDIAGRYPSASAVGSSWDSLCVYALAARTPGQPIENPKQVSAYNYPRQYGPKSPSFSRALVRKWQESACLFLSGTASIKGHESKHREALSAQAEETLDNLANLVAAASQASGIEFSLDPASSVLKAYVRRSSDHRAVCNLLDRHFGHRMKLLYLEADICRAELLLELDGVVFSPPQAA